MDKDLARWARVDRRADRAQRLEHRRRRHGVSIVGIRISELDRFFDHRYGATLPPDDAGLADAYIMTHHLAALRTDPHGRIVEWLARRCPWMMPDEADTMAKAAIAKPRKWRARTLGQRLGLTAAERKLLAITSIAACDQTDEERAQERAEQKRLAEAARRRAAGATTRTQSVAAAKPWRQAGVSRTTWYRQRKAVSE